MARMGIVGPSGRRKPGGFGSRMRQTMMAMQVDTYCATTATLLTSASLSKSKAQPSAMTSTETIDDRDDRRAEARRAALEDAPAENASCAKVST